MSHSAKVTPTDDSSRPEGAALRRPSVEFPLLRADEAAELLAVRPSWVYEAVRDGRLPCLRVGRHIRFTRALLEQWLAQQP